MAPPIDSARRTVICTDGTPWRLVVRRSVQRDSIVMTQSCGGTNAERTIFENRIDSIIANVARQAQRLP